MRPIDISATENGCHEATNTQTKNGYVRVKRDGVVWYAHRLSWVSKNGPIPNGLFVLHKCDNRKCINVDHLFLGTLQDNYDDMRNKNRGNPAKGEDNGQAKLSKED